MSRRYEISSSGEVEFWVVTTRFGGVGFGGRGFDTRISLFVRLSSSAFRGCCEFGLMFLRPGLPGGGHYTPLWSLRDRLRRGFRMCVDGWNRNGLTTRPFGRHGSTPAQVHLLGRVTGPLGFRSCRLACGYALSAAFRCFLRNSRLPFLPLYTATVVRCVVFPAATALRLFPRERTSTGEVGAPTSDALGCVSAVTLRVAEALVALTMQGAFWRHVRFH